MAVRFPDGATTRFEYDSEHLMTAEINPVGGRIERAYDSFGRALSATLADGTTRTAENVQSLAADLGGSLGAETDPAPIKRPDDIVASYTNEASDRYEIEIGPVGTAAKVTDPAGHVREFMRDADGKPIEQREASGRRFDTQYDGNGRPIAITDAATSNTLSLVYDANLGVLTALDTGEGSPLTVDYDSEGRQTRVVSSGGRQLAFTYEGAGIRPVSETAPSGLVSNLEYDPSGNLTRMTEGTSVTALSYTPAGDISSITDAEGRVFLINYDLVGNLVEFEFPGGIRNEYTYDARGLLTTFQAPSGNAHQFTYNDRGQPTALFSPIGDALRIGYEYADGRLSRVIWGDGSALSYAYSNGNVASLTKSAAETTFTYDHTTGLVDGVTAPNNFQLDFEYDAHGRLLDSQWSGTVNGKVARGYDDQSRLASIAVNDAGAHAIEYDADDLITRVGPMTVTRDPAKGHIDGTTLGNCTDTRTYNERDELLSLSASVNGVPVYNLTLTRDKIGRIVTKTEMIQGTNHQVGYEYGAAGRLVREIMDGTAIDYVYDANGNRLSRTVTGAATETGTYNAGDQLISYAGMSYTYDGCGRLQSRGTDSFNYDVRGGLQSATLGEGVSLTYLDPVGERRVSESRNGIVQRQFVYLNELTIVGELDASGETRSVFGYATLFGAPDFLQPEGKTYRIFSDDLGSPRLVVDCDTGAVMQKMRHDAFGRVLEDTSPRFQLFGFSGGIYDTDTSWLRFGARDYDPFTARWTAPDPILFDGSAFNLYQYAAGDPVNFIDRNGLAPTKAVNSNGGSGACPLPETPQVLLDWATFLSVTGPERVEFYLSLPPDRRRTLMTAQNRGNLPNRPRRNPVTFAPDGIGGNPNIAAGGIYR